MGMNEIMSEDHPKTHEKKKKRTSDEEDDKKKEGRGSYCVLCNYVNYNYT